MEKKSYFIFNIKLQTKKNNINREHLYIDLIKRLTEGKNKYFAVSKNEAITIYSSYGDNDKAETSYLYGRAAKGMFIPGPERQVLKGGELLTESNDPNVLISPVIVNYIFVPSAHRLAIEKQNNGPQPIEMEKFLNHELRKVIEPEDILEIILEKDDNAIKEIFSAKAVYSISYKVSYTNEDLTGDIAELFDQELKETNIGELTVTANADNKDEGLKIENSKLLEGGLKLAQNNGEIRRAVIKQGQKKKTISNKDKPKILKLEYRSEESHWTAWFRHIMNKYRPNNQ